MVLVLSCGEDLFLHQKKLAMDFNKATALASLTATYTDSENEQDSDLELAPGPTEKIISRDSSPLLEERDTKEIKRSKLVSYTETWEDDRLDSEESQNSDSDDQDERSTDSKKSVENDTPHSPVSFHRSLLDLRSEDIRLPPEPSGKSSNTLQEKITELYEKKNREGKDMNASIQRRKDFRNPSIYEKLIAYCGIDEQGTNYPPEIYDPHSWGPESFYDELAKRQKEEMDKREKEKKERTKVEFISGTAKKSEVGGAGDNGKRKTKWDIGAAQSVAMPALKPATLITNSAPGFPVVSTGGTKPTIISAFGTITKKAKQ